MAPPLLSLRAVELRFGDTPLLRGVDLSVAARDRLCLVGRNGAGKSTLLRLAAGAIEPEAGERFVQPGTRIAYLPQAVEFGAAPDLATYVADQAEPPADHAAAAALDQVGLEAARAPATLSGGEARRAALAKVLAVDPDVLLMDEPTNHLDIRWIEWLEATLARLQAAIVVISHDRRFLATVARATLWLDRGRLLRQERGIEAFEDWAETLLVEEAVTARKRDKLIAEETRWSHQGITARRKRNQGRLRRLVEMRRTRADEIERLGAVRMSAAAGPLSGRLVIEARGIEKRFGSQAVIREFSTRILRGDRVGIIGPNGAGKTTLVAMLAGTLAPDAGNVRHGANLKPQFIDQNRTALEPTMSVQDWLCDAGGEQIMVGGRPRHITSYLKDFLFDPAQARSPLGSLSGGERNRVLLAKAFAAPSNLIVLDEPTNDLDMETLDLLQEVLSDYQGTVLLVSHDRDFLDRVVTATFALEGDGRVTEYAGGYSDYLRQRRSPEPARKAARTTRPAGRGEGAAQKLTFKQKEALEKLPGMIAGLEREIATLRLRLADPSLYAKDPAAFQELADKLSRHESALARVEEEWLELELLRETLDGK
jgi:ATP-binding cassette subfamily F protein uup